MIIKIACLVTRILFVERSMRLEQQTASRVEVSTCTGRKRERELEGEGGGGRGREGVRRGQAVLSRGNMATLWSRVTLCVCVCVCVSECVCVCVWCVCACVCVWRSGLRAGGPRSPLATGLASATNSRGSKTETSNARRGDRRRASRQHRSATHAWAQFQRMEQVGQGQRDNKSEECLQIVQVVGPGPRGVHKSSYPEGEQVLPGVTASFVLPHSLCPPLIWSCSYYL
jgi:hypothetical protein